MNLSTPGLPVHHQLPEFTQTHVHWVSDAIQPSHPLLSPSLPAFNFSQHQGLSKWVRSSHQVSKVLEFQLQHHSNYQFSSVSQSCLTLWDPMNRSTPGLPVHHKLPEFTQTHIHWVSDAIQPSHSNYMDLKINIWANSSTQSPRTYFDILVHVLHQHTWTLTKTWSTSQC